MSNFIEYAKRELDLAGYTEGSEFPNVWVRENVLELIEKISEQGHSGTSIHYVIELFKRLATYTPITPLTGEDDEWNEVDEVNGVWQNKRHPAIFKSNDRGPYWLDGVVFWEWAYDDEEDKVFKAYFTSKDSFVNIEFPWTAPDKPEYRFVPNEQYPNEEIV